MTPNEASKPENKGKVYFNMHGPVGKSSAKSK